MPGRYRTAFCDIASTRMGMRTPPVYKRARPPPRRSGQGLTRTMHAELLLMMSLLLVAALRTADTARVPKSWDSWWEVDGSNVEDLAADVDVEVVYLPALLAREPQLAADRLRDVDVPLHYAFEAFGRSFELQLVPNRRLVASQFGVWSERGEEPALASPDAICHYLHAGPDVVAAFSACRDHALHGLIVTDNTTYEVRPLETGAARADADRSPHVVRRAPPPAPPALDARPLPPRPQPRAHPALAKPSVYTIEIALFLDEAAYKIFYPFCNNNEEDLRDMLLAYINGVQALYQHASLGARIQLSLVRLTLLRSQPGALPAHAERGRLLDAFCAYQRKLNVDDDRDPQHWDMALLLSGLDLYSEEGGRRSGVTMGLAPVGGVCLPAHACVVAEFGADDSFGRPYPSAGFTSVYILAHEIGHNLGMHHDGTGNSCATDGYIMSPSRGTNGEATWSPCSARVAAHLEWATCLYDGGDPDDTVSDELRHERFGGAPGTVWGAKRQCELLLRDRDASPLKSAPEPQHCAQLACRTPHRTGFYYAGPALPGTACGHNMWCQGGSCVKAEEVPESPTPGADGEDGAGQVDGGWSTWQEGACRSGCTVRSMGFRERRRVCNTISGNCDGPSYDVALCDDSKICAKKRRSSTSELAARKCGEFAALLPELDPRGGGLQAPHDPTRMWMGCAVFCRRASGGGFYAPRIELNDAGLDPYFPDGTWCHHDGTHDYYCLQHHCLPENFKMGAQMHVWELPSEDVWGPFNARALDPPASASAALRDYFSLDDRGAPLLRSALPPRLPPDPERNWEDNDYIEISNSQKQSKNM